MSTNDREDNPLGNIGSAVDKETRDVRFVSVSQATKFDVTQYGGCERAWFFDKVMGLEPESTLATKKGQETHKSIEHYLKTGEDVLPPIVRVGKHFIPAPGPKMLIEHQFGNERTVQAVEKWRKGGLTEVEIDQALQGSLYARAGGLIIPFVGFIDVVNERGNWIDNAGDLHDEPESIEVVDWKTTKTISKFAKKPHELLQTVQMVGYARWVSVNYPYAERVRLSHGYFQTQGGKLAEKRSTSIMLAEVDRLWQRVERVVLRMQDVARERDPMKVEGNLDSCTAFGRGCSYRDRCPRSAEKSIEDLFNIRKKPKNNEDKPMPSMADLLRERGLLPSGDEKKNEPKNEPIVESKVDKNVSALIEQEKAIKSGDDRGACVDCTEILTPSNSSRLQGGAVVHIGCTAKNPVLPPDAARSEGKASAEPLPQELRSDLAPVVVQEVLKFDDKPEDKPAEKVEDKPAAEAPARTRRTRKKSDEKPEDKPVEKVEHASEPERVITHDLHPMTVEDERRNIDMMRDSLMAEIEKTRRARLGFVGVFVNVNFSNLPADLSPRPLSRYIGELHEMIRSKFGVDDMRLGEQEELKFGKWKGLLSALVRTVKPEDGSYYINAPDEIDEVVLRALRESGFVIVRGVSLS